jgi:hypothetical protein
MQQNSYQQSINKPETWDLRLKKYYLCSQKKIGHIDYNGL